MPDLLQAPRRSTVLGLPIHLLSDYPGWLLSQAKHSSGAHVVTLNAEMAMQAEKTPNLAAVIRSAELVIPDGAGVVLYLRLRGQKVQRCPGIELAEALLRQMPLLGTEGTVFFYGGAPGVAQSAADRLQYRIPGLKIAGVQHGYLSEEERSQLDETLRRLQPRLILVGLGVPRQELWIAEHRYLCPDSIWIGVGGSFDIWSGKKTRAPGWLANNHLEWVYRLYQEPWRWRRMLALPKFALRALTDAR
ncbi:WecB/TagA/CpsF family glycosyltransferase [Leptolyngbya ohadii]|uniref:WecB/TagA/CpsF family glycosyltransferase n=1 Tax=Leptolyngbya ohadii TaxID=1962290 RepID=UPI0015C596DC|nr:WecB/TagA/CpsF family glycosyltransferase [Leptolyngbya ohadii]